MNSSLHSTYFPILLSLFHVAFGYFYFHLFLAEFTFEPWTSNSLASPVSKVQMLSPSATMDAQTQFWHLDILCFVSCFQTRFQICGIRDTVSSFSYLYFPPSPSSGRVFRGRIIHPQTFWPTFPCLRSRVIRYYWTLPPCVTTRSESDVWTRPGHPRV